MNMVLKVVSHSIHHKYNYYIPIIADEHNNNNNNGSIKNSQRHYHC